MISDLQTSSKYLTIITIFLYEKMKNEYCSHTDLSIALGVSKNNLSNIIKRIENIGLFKVEKEGRNKYYYLTDDGVEYYQTLKNKENRFYYKRAKWEINYNIKRKK